VKDTAVVTVTMNDDRKSYVVYQSTCTVVPWVSLKGYFSYWKLFQ